MNRIAASMSSRSCCSSRMIWAATVTSSGWVTLSQIRKPGSATSASTIIARCIMPPEYWYGNSSKRRAADGIRTAIEQGDRRACWPRVPPISGRTARSFSAICTPTGIVGSSELPGSAPI